MIMPRRHMLASRIAMYSIALLQGDATMIKLYHAQRTRSIRIVWLLEELGLPYELATVAFNPPRYSFEQSTPAGKFPVIEDGALTMFESGAILEYLIEKYGNGRLAPAIGSPDRGPYLQWVHFAEATALPPIGDVTRHTLLLPEADRIPKVAEDGRVRAINALNVLERALGGKQYLVGNDFSGADIMMGYFLLAARMLGAIGTAHPNVGTYWERLAARSGLQKALRV
jgi:glutathione S-transferase